MEEVRKHTSTEDAWTVLKGRVRPAAHACSMHVLLQPLFLSTRLTAAKCAGVQPHSLSEVPPRRRGLDHEGRWARLHPALHKVPCLGQRGNAAGELPHWPPSSAGAAQACLSLARCSRCFTLPLLTVWCPFVA